MDINTLCKKSVLDLTGKKARLIIADKGHDSNLEILEKMIAYSDCMAEQSNKLRYRYIPGPLTIIGGEKWLRLFCSLNQIEYEVLYSFPPMPVTNTNH